MSKVIYYRSGQDRNNDDALSHTYAETAAGNLWPMCGYGWNRSDGERLSIFRGSPGTEGDCSVCAKNVAMGKRPHFKPFGNVTLDDAGEGLLSPMHARIRCIKNQAVFMLQLNAR